MSLRLLSLDLPTQRTYYKFYCVKKESIKSIKSGELEGLNFRSPYYSAIYTHDKATLEEQRTEIRYQWKEGMEVISNRERKQIEPTEQQTQIIEKGIHVLNSYEAALTIPMEDAVFCSPAFFARIIVEVSADPDDFAAAGFIRFISVVDNKGRQCLPSSVFMKVKLNKIVALIYNEHRADTESLYQPVLKNL